MKKLLMIAVFWGTLTAPATAQETRTHIDALDRMVEIPVAPKRIVSMHDHALTLPLVELGAPVVGSHGRVREDGSTYLRSVNTVMNVDFDNSEIEFIGAWNSIDFEKIASLKPDLIIARAPWDEEQIEKLEAIAPTAYVDDTADALELYQSIADVAGKLEEFNYLNAKYEHLIADAKGWLGNPSYTYSKIQTWDGKLTVYANYGALTRALDDLGFLIAGTGAELRNKGVGWGEEVSAELLPEQDADFLFDTYRIDQGQNDGPQVAWGRMETVLPNFCTLLSACQKGNYIFIPREHAAPNSFATLTMNVHYVVSHVAGGHHPKQ
jgi:iron complex transport system substrate-binding protein